MGMPLNRQARTCASPLGGGRAKIENSSRRHPRKFGLKRFLVVRRSWRGNGVAFFLGYLPGKNYWRRDRDCLVPPRWMDAAVCRAEVCYPFGRKHGRHRAVRRREFISLVGGAAASWPIAAQAQQAAMPVIGLLSGTDREASRLDAIWQGLNEASYIEGRNAAIEYRWAESRLNRLPALAADLVRRRVNVIVAIQSAAAPLAAKAATATIPIVFSIGGDAVKLGLVSSLNRPGGNITGTTFLYNTLAPKRLELLHELVPNAAVIGLLVNPKNPASESETSDTQAAARALGLKLIVQNASSSHDIDAAFTSFVQH